MEDRLDAELMEFIRSTTEKAAREDWVRAVRAQDAPPYNYRFDHVAEVVKVAEYLAEGTSADPLVIRIAGWLHDAAKPGIGEMKNHAEASAEIAFALLSETKLEQQLIEKVCDTIRKHAGLTIDEPLEPLEAQILWEADKIVKLGMIGFMHYVLNSVQMAPGKTLRDLSRETEKYLPLATKIAASMHTKKGRKMAKERLETLKRVSNALSTELELG